jgi:hypothetical protein
MTKKEITPEGSVVTVVLDARKEQPPDLTWVAEMKAEREVIEKAQQDRADGIARLVELGLTEDQARAIAGMK